ncbi:bifunctional oligoribonuclease/PAP phosphatase NrnA [Amphibacillus indicireducens]|uniref:Bifunctional oligoribonuclease/PAP phosphatase NrnA n=1 Tax=Amphibacillus indicireducens TaxID=1076330 RepID=A0ABP7W0F2_9BACI
MQKEILAQIREKIMEYNRIIIHRHVRPDLDAVGSQVGLATWIKENFPNKEVYCVGENDETLTYLVTMDEITDQMYQDALVIICDTANHPRIDDQRYPLAKERIKIDHHPIVDQYGDLNWVDTEASSTSEMIYNLITSSDQQNLKMTTDVARLLYAGIIGDTGRFLFQSTTPRTFEIASELVKHPFNRSEIYENLYEIKPGLAKLKGWLLDQLSIDDLGVVGIKLTKDILEKYQVTADQSSALVQVYGGIKGIDCWAMFVEEDDQIRVRIRSKKTKINHVAEQFNGGGHPFASGATVYSWAEADRLIEALKAACK